MIYVMSDIHGCYEKYRTMLETIEFAADDTLYMLGDVLDRGPDGFKILLDLTARPNVVGLLGNHELLAAAALPSLLRIMCRGRGAASKPSRADGGLDSKRRKRFYPAISPVP